MSEKTTLAPEEGLSSTPEEGLSPTPEERLSSTPEEGLSPTPEPTMSPAPEQTMSVRAERSASHNRGADMLKFLLTPFICFWAFGFPDGIGLVSALSGFVIPAYFILSGFFVMDPNRRVRGNKLKRAVRRSLSTFLILLACYLAFNVVVGENWLGALVNKRVLFDFLVLNVWPFPVGNNIWFIQSLLYAYIFLLIINRWRWVKPPFYKILMVLTMLLMVAAGELAALLHFHFLGYAYIPGGAVTRALPYVLLGMVLREKTERLSAIRGWVYILVFVLGGALALGEILWLGRTGNLVYLGHMIGYGVMAAAVCCWAVSRPRMKRTFFSIHGRKYAKRIYALSNPVCYAVIVILNMKLPRFLNLFAVYAGPIVYAACLLICIIITKVKKWGSKPKKRKPTKDKPKKKKKKKRKTDILYKFFKI